MNITKQFIALFLVMLTLCSASALSANALSYYDLVKDSKASVNFDDDKEEAGNDSAQNRHTTYNEYTNYNIVGEQTVEVRTTQHSTYSAKVPAILIVDGFFKPNDTNNFSFEVSVEGNLAGDAAILLQPENSFIMSSAGKEDITASITQEKTKFTYEDGVRINKPVIASGLGAVSGMTAGLWYGSWNYNIKFVPIYDLDCYTWEDDDYTTGVVTGITEQGKDKLETFGVMMLPDADQAENYDGVNTIKSGSEYYFTDVERTDCEIIIPKTVERIEDSTLSTSPFAFANVAKVTFEKPSNLKYIGDYAFCCAKIKEPIEIPASVEELGAHSIAEINGYFSNSSKYAHISFEQGSNLKTIGKQAFRYSNVTGKLVLPEGLETIGTEAFSSCNYTEIVIPDSVTTIGERAFYKRTANGTSPIIKLNFPKNLKNWDEAFSCSTIQTLTLPSTLTEIPAGSFKSCNHLYSIDIPFSVTKIGAYAFAYTALTNVLLPNQLEYLGCSAFNGTNITALVIPDSVNEVGGFYYYGEGSPVHNCKKLTTITIGKNTPNLDLFNLGACENLKEISIHGTTRISAKAFNVCKKVTTVNIDPGVEYIGESAFANCNALTKVNFKGTIDEWFGIEFENMYSDPTFVAHNLYLNNKVVTGLTIPGWVDKIGGSYSDKGRCVAWKNLTNVVINNGVQEILPSAFYGCSNIAYVSIPESVTSIGKSAFEGCTQLAGIKLPSGLSEISDYAFYKTGLKNVSIPNNVTKIGEWAFSNITKLATVNLPDSLKSIGEYAFAGSTAISSLIIPNSVETIGRNAFGDYSKTICVDNVAGSISGAPWGARTSIVWLREAK